MSKIIAVCVDAVVFKDNRIFDERWARKFPGAQTMPILAAMAQKSGFPIVTGDVALSHVRSGYWNAADINLVQELDAPCGLELIHLGAVAKVVIALELPKNLAFLDGGKGRDTRKYCGESMSDGEIWDMRSLSKQIWRDNAQNSSFLTQIW